MTQEDYILIDTYLKGLLSENDNISFLERLDSDAEFKKTFEFEKQALDTLNEEGWSFVSNSSAEVKEYKTLLEESDMLELKQTLKHVNSNHNTVTKSNTKTAFYYLAAASVVIFLAFQFFFNQGMSNQDLYNNYILHEDLPSFATRSSGDETERLLITAERLFENKEYKAALTIFEPILILETNNTSLYLYTGIAQTESNLYKDAEYTFDKLITNKSIDGSIGYWYKALLFIKQDRLEEAKLVLNEIVTHSYYKYTEAKDLLSQLEDE